MMLLGAASEIQFCDHDALSSDAFAMENVFPGLLLALMKLTAFQTSTYRSKCML